MPFTALNHALADHILTQLRDENTQQDRFRFLTRSLTHILLTEATRNLPVTPHTIRTPMENMEGAILSTQLTLIPVLRAGLGMLDAALEMLPDAAVGYVGMERDETTAIARSYYCKLPPLQGKTAILLDPMLATGGSASHASERLYDAGASTVLLICIVAAPQGVEKLESAFPNLQIISAALDRQLDGRSYILPGLGDFGDRLYGTL